MINFHKFSYLDVRKLFRYIDTKDFWLNKLNPVYLFVHSDYYKPEIAYTNDYCFIRFLMPDIGICYYPPLGNNDISEGIKIIKKDCIENGFDFYMSFFDETLKYKVTKYDITLLDNQKFSNYIFLTSDLSFSNKKKYKRSIKLINKFNSSYPNAYVKRINKEDFPIILSFLQKWQEQSKPSYETYFKVLNIVKKIMDHLYELDILGLLLLDENEIYGIIFSCVYKNMSYTLLKLSLDEPGLLERLLMEYALVINSKVNYVNFEEDENLFKLCPFKIETYYSNFRL